MNRNSHNQISLFELYTEMDDLTSAKHTTLFDLFDKNINIFEMIPKSFYDAYYSHVGSNREFPLEGMIKSLIFYDLLGLVTLNTLVFIIDVSSDFRKFLNFPRAPHISKFSRFKATFHTEINQLFHTLADQIATNTDDFQTDDLISNTRGLELYLKVNNPKFYLSMIKISKSNTE